MSYFENSYSAVRFPIQTVTNQNALRRAQYGAIHSVTGHFSNKNDSAIVVMPTGSGKTAVLMLSAFVERAKRVLVLTPSRLVRNQIKEEFNSLNTLKRINALEGDVIAPNVVEIEKVIISEDDWEDLRRFDVVVATPNSVSPAISNVPPPPNDLFDLILVDEAHHSPAKTWTETLQSFPNSKKILFTATPFRRDKKKFGENSFIHTRFEMLMRMKYLAIFNIFR